MKKKTIRIIVLIIIIMALIGGVSLWYVYKKPAPSVASQNPDFTVEIPALLNEFGNDENAANAKYLDKVIQIQGPLQQISDNGAEIMLYIKNKDDMSGVNCNFSREAIDTTQLKRSEILTIKGICSGYLLDVVLNKCAIVNK